MNIQMVDLRSQYLKLKNEIDKGIHDVLDTCSYINGPAVKSFQKNLADYLGTEYVIPCANGTDALQIAMMALGLKPGDEVIVPSFTYVATAEVIALLGLIPVMVDVDADDFNVTADLVEAAITPATKAIVPVHLFGQSAPMEQIMAVAEKHGLFVIEDNAQALGCDYHFSNNTIAKTGVLGHVGCTSFYPSKNLGAYGDGGAISTTDKDLAEKIAMIANHGQSVRYYHDIIGCNSRLDSIQAAILDVKLRHLDSFAEARRKAADYYDAAFADMEQIITPKRNDYSKHVFHQYTLKVPADLRDALKDYLDRHKVPNMIYYPVPLQDQKAFKHYYPKGLELPVTEDLCKRVISLPMHTELTEAQLGFISEKVLGFFI
jgi:UDP-2-acetamido-2-deoxy-ribo-hexuluronate aminotransferase